MSSIQFLGAAGTVTGSRHLVEHNGVRVLLDCGLFQGVKKVRSRNWDSFPVDPATIDHVVVSHAHIDHTGWLPRLIRQGYTNPIHATPATRDLSSIMLPDSGRIQEADAEYANRKRFSKHDPALPLYTEKDALETIKQIRALPYAKPRDLGGGITVEFAKAGHILGSAVVYLTLAGNGESKRIMFSGDLGRYDQPIIHDPDPVKNDGPTYVLVECTYGDRNHRDHKPEETLKRHVKEMVAERGVLIIPAFSVGRTQGVLYHLRQLQLDGEIPSLPIFVDSPLATNATSIYLMHREEHDEEMTELLLGDDDPIHPERVHFTRSVRESKKINERKGPMIIISASGMATGGRVLHHLKRRLPSTKTTVLFVGYQAYGTRGRRLLEGEKEIKIHGEQVPVNAKIGQIYGFSAHADASEIDRWLDTIEKPPTRTFCVHGEPKGLEAVHARLTERGWDAYIPEYQETVEI